MLSLRHVDSDIFATTISCGRQRCQPRSAPCERSSADGIGTGPVLSDKTSDVVILRCWPPPGEHIPAELLHSLSSDFR